MSYVKLEVNLFGVSGLNPLKLMEQVDKILRDEMVPDTDHDLEVELVEYSGTWEGLDKK